MDTGPPADTPAYSAETLAARLRELAARFGRTDIPMHRFEAETGISRQHVIRALGSYTALREAAGLTPARKSGDDETLLRALRDACLAAGGIPSSAQMERFGAYRRSLYFRRWRDWRGTLNRLREWVEANDPAFPYRAALSGGTGPMREPKAPGAEYGAPLGFGPLMYEPTNEAGVLVLFGVVAMPLGFAIERVGSGFPDCEAKRRVAGGWRRVRIELEYRSRNFLRHGHDPAACDLIVCWEHNWPESPVEVVELKTELQKLTPSAGLASAPPANSGDREFTCR
jgi:hypothetical protein